MELSVVVAVYAHTHNGSVYTFLPFFYASFQKVNANIFNIVKTAFQNNTPQSKIQNDAFEKHALPLLFPADTFKTMHLWAHEI